MGKNKKRIRRLVGAMFERNAAQNLEKKFSTDHLILWQMDRLAEECSELIQAVMKVKRYGYNPDRLNNLWEEMSHVKICSEVVKGLLNKCGIEDSFKSELDSKLSQLEESYKPELSNAGKN